MQPLMLTQGSEVQLLVKGNASHVVIAGFPLTDENNTHSVDLLKG